MQFISISRRRTESFGADAFEAHLGAEAQRVRELYAEGTVRAIWSRHDIPGAVMLLESERLETARAAVGSLPRARLDMLEVQSVPLRAYRAFCPPE